MFLVLQVVSFLCYELYVSCVASCTVSFLSKPQCIAGKQELVTSNPDENVICPWFYAKKPGGVYTTLSSRNALISGLKSGSTVSGV